MKKIHTKIREQTNEKWSKKKKKQPKFQLNVHILQDFIVYTRIIRMKLKLHGQKLWLFCFAFYPSVPCIGNENEQACYPITTTSRNHSNQKQLQKKKIIEKTREKATLLLFWWSHRHAHLTLYIHAFIIDVFNKQETNKKK